MAFAYFCYFRIVIKSNCANRDRRSDQIANVCSILCMKYDRWIIHMHIASIAYASMYACILYVWQYIEIYRYILYIYIFLRLRVYRSFTLVSCQFVCTRGDLRSPDLPYRLAALLCCFCGFSTIPCLHAVSLKSNG